MYVSNIVVKLLSVLNFMIVQNFIRIGLNQTNNEAIADKKLIQ